MRKHFLAAFVVLVCVLPVFAQQLKWTPFRSAEFKFAVVFPNEPVKDDPVLDKRTDGSVASTTFMFTASAPGVYASIAGGTDYNFTVDAERELLASRDNFVKGLSAKLVSSRRFDFQSADGKLPAISFSLESEVWLGKAIIIVKGNRGYMAAFVYQKGRGYAGAANKFLASFEITK